MAGRIAILSTSWQTAALMAPQDQDYRAFIIQLHARMKKAASKAALTGGLRPRIYRRLVSVALLRDRDGRTFHSRHRLGEWAGALFLVGFAALFAWQVGGFIGRNRPRLYFDDCQKRCYRKGKTRAFITRHSQHAPFAPAFAVLGRIQRRLSPRMEIECGFG